MRLNFLVAYLINMLSVAGALLLRCAVGGGRQPQRWRPRGLANALHRLQCLMQVRIPPYLLCSLVCPLAQFPHIAGDLPGSQQEQGSNREILPLLLSIASTLEWVAFKVCSRSQKCTLQGSKRLILTCTTDVQHQKLNAGRCHG